MEVEEDGGSETAGGLAPLDSLLEDFESFTQAGYKKVQQGVMASNLLPDKDTYKLYSTDPKFVDIMKKESHHILDVIQMVLDYAKVTGRIADHSSEEKGDLILEGNDMLLDRSTNNMDILEGFREPGGFSAETGFHKKLSGSWNKDPSKPSGSAAVENGLKPPNPQRRTTPAPSGAPTPPNTVTLHMAKITTRPQIFFKDKINNQNEPWEPRIKEKPNNLKPLSILLEVNEEGYESYSHPYEYELDHWSPPEDQLKKQSVQRPKPVENTPLVYVETQEQLSVLMSELKDHKQIAVDLEHHSYRSFMGFTCLMQISTKDKDYVVDTLSLRNDLYVLNEIFTKPSVLKVFHGAENDVDWLQRDLSLYVVNMFDTYHAAKVLQFPKLNLAYLLKKYFDISAEKHFQLYDWRSRPLSDKAIKYAREDTHYLLHIYARMSNQLIDDANGKTNLLESVYQRSTETCKRKYVKPLLEDDSHMLLYRKGKRLFDNRQLYALKELFTWRDTIARQEDESTGYVLPNHMMLQIAENLPREMQGILACCNPIPPLVRQHVLELHNIVLKARSQPLVKAIQEHRVVGGQTDSRIVGGASRSSRVFDLAHSEFRDDLPTVIENTLSISDREDDEEEAMTEPGTIRRALKPQFPLPREESDDAMYSKKVMKSWNDIENRKLLNPYQRYKMVLPYVNQMEKEEREKEEKAYREREKKRIEEEEERKKSIYEKNMVSLKKEEDTEDVPLNKKYQKRKNKKRTETQETSGESVTASPGKQEGRKLIKLEEKKRPQQLPVYEARVGGPSRVNDADDGVGIITAEINTKVDPPHRWPRPGGQPDRFPSNNRPQNQGADKGFTPFDYLNTNFNKFNLGGNRGRGGGGNKNQNNRQKRRQNQQQQQQQQGGQQQNNTNFPGSQTNNKGKNKQFGMKKSISFKRKGRGGGKPL